MSPDLRVEAILEVLQRHGVRYVVIGGIAAVAHGAAYVTLDVDITPEATAANLDALSAALDELDARIRTQSEPDGLPFSHNGASLATSQVWNLTTPFGDLDVSMVPSGTHGYPDLDRDAIDLVLLGVPTRLASLADIIRSKAAADRPKDRQALPMLRRLLEAQQEGRATPP